MEVMPGYKQTEVGVIPEDWEAKPLAGMAAIVHGFGFQSQYFKPLGKYRLTTPGHFHETGGFRDVGDKQKFYNGPLPDGYLLSDGDLIVAMTEQADGLLGSAALVPIGDTYLHNQRLGKIKVLSPEVSLSFLYRIFNSNAYRAKVRETAAGTKVKHTSPSKLLEIPVPFPPTKTEQEAIAEALSDVDALIESLEQLIAKKRHVKQRAMQELLTGQNRLPGLGTGRGFKSSELGLIPRDWNCFQLPALTVKDANSIKIGPFGSALKKEYLVKEGYKVYGQENVFNEDMEIGDRFINGEHFKRLKSCEIKAGDFLISMMGTVGKCLIVPNGITEGIMDSHLLRLKLDPLKVSSEFLFQMFQTRIISDQVKKLSVGGIMEGLSSKIIKSLYLPVTWIEEQDAIAEALSDMDAEITALESKLSKYRQIKQGMMHNLLTGRIRLV